MADFAFGNFIFHLLTFSQVIEDRVALHKTSLKAGRK